MGHEDFFTRVAIGLGIVVVAVIFIALIWGAYFDKGDR